MEVGLLRCVMQKEALTATFTLWRSLLYKAEPTGECGGVLF